VKLVADANILFSAFLKKGLTRDVWFDPRVALFAPAYVLDEYSKYAADLCQRSGLSDAAASALFGRLVRRVSLVPTEELIPYISAAEHLIDDPKDAPYVACALSVGADIWTHDRHFRQPRIRVWSTTALAEELELM